MRQPDPGVVAVAARALLFGGGPPVITLSGMSMYPTFTPGDRIFIETVPAEPIPGHCYVFLYQGNLNVHRLVRIDEQNAIFWGDHSLLPDRIRRDQIVAAVRRRQPALATRLLLLTNGLFIQLTEWQAWMSRVRIWLVYLICKGGGR